MNIYIYIYILEVAAIIVVAVAVIVIAGKQRIKFLAEWFTPVCAQLTSMH